MSKLDLTIYPLKGNPKIKRLASLARNPAYANARKLASIDRIELERRLPIFSNKRLIVSGKVLELYEYEKPYSYNWNPPHKATGETAPGGNTSEKREDHILRARRQIRRIIDANTVGLPIFITYTFKKNIKELSEANPLFSSHIKELQRRYGKLQYLCVPEFQKRGAVHYHVIFFNLPYIPKIKDKFQTLWKHGFIQVKAIRKIQRIGLYVSKYLQKSIDDSRTKNRKSFFCSRNIIRPIEIRNEQSIDNFIKENKMRLEFKSSFSSFTGSVNYSRLKI